MKSRASSYGIPGLELRQVKFKFFAPKYPYEESFDLQ